LSKGASKQVDAAAKELFESKGVDALKRVSKMHFRTAFVAQGSAEPATKEWKKR